MFTRPTEVLPMPDEPEASKRRGRWVRGRGGGRDDRSREALEREAAAEMGLPGEGEDDEVDEREKREEREEREERAETGPAGRRPPPAHRARKQWSRLRDALASESDAARRERLEREAAEEMRLDPWRRDRDEEG
jgi:hypothetical protein